MDLRTDTKKRTFKRAWIRLHAQNMLTILDSTPSQHKWEDLYDHLKTENLQLTMEKDIHELQKLWGKWVRPPLGFANHAHKAKENYEESRDWLVGLAHRSMYFGGRLNEFRVSLCLCTRYRSRCLDKFQGRRSLIQSCLRC